MRKAPPMFVGAVGVLVLLLSGAADAKEIQFIMPPQYDYQTICKAAAERFDPEEVEALRRRPLSELTPEELVRLAEAYSDNSDVITPDYAFALTAVDQVLKLPYRGENQPFIDDALFIKADILHKGRAGEPRRAEAKAILETLIVRNHAKAHRRYGEIYEDEQRFPQAMESYKKAIISGNITAYFNLARLYHEKKVKASPAEFRRALSNLHDATLQNIAKGNCQVMVEMAKFYRLLEPMEGAHEHSVAWFRHAASTPTISGKLLYAELLLPQAEARNDWREVVALWEGAATLGSVKAMRHLGDYYLSGHAFDPEKARHWLQLASLRKDVKISTLMQWAESLKHLSPPPYADIITIYERAAGHGQEAAWYELGRLYQYDMRSEGHLEKAIAYYQKAAEAKHVAAMRALQTAYSCNIGTGFNREKATFWQQQIETHSDEAFLDAFLRAAERGFAGVTRAMARRLESMAAMPEAVEAKALLAAYYFHQGEEDLANRQTEALLRRDSEENDVYPGHYALGKLYYEGIGFTDGKEYGLKLLERASAAGNASALMRLGDMHAERRQYSQAISYYQKAAKENNTAYRKLYYIYVDLGNVPEAVKSLERLAADGDAEAMLRLAEHYYSDLKEPVQAAYWFEQATRHYPCEAETLQRIAQAYRRGINGAPLDEKQAAAWLRYLQHLPIRAHSQPVVLARTILYLEGEGSEPQKKREAVEVLTEMAEAGNEDARQTLLDYHLLQSDAKQLIAMLTRQAETGSAISMLYLSNLYLSGFADIPPDKEKALHWLQQAKEAGSETAAFRLALLTK